MTNKLSVVPTTAAPKAVATTRQKSIKKMTINEYSSFQEKYRPKPAKTYGPGHVPYSYAELLGMDFTKEY